jgi:hypothetical protein
MLHLARGLQMQIFILNRKGFIKVRRTCVEIRHVIGDKSSASSIPMFLLLLRLQYALQYGYTLSVGYCFGESDLYYTPFNGYVHGPSMYHTSRLHKPQQAAVVGQPWRLIVIKKGHP